MSHPALFRSVLQSLPVFFLLIWSGCATTADPAAAARAFPPGMYVFEAPFVYEGMAEIRPIPNGAAVQLLETFEGNFEFHLRGDDGLRIRNDNMDYPGLKRRFVGTGTLRRPGHADGDAEIWLTAIGRFGRDHRKGAWTLRPATEAETTRFERARQALEERKRRAGMIE